MTNSGKQFSGRSRRGATLLEATLLILITSLVAVGTGVALQTLIKVPEANNRVLAVSNLLIDKMEKLRALGFTTLSSTVNGSDSPVIDGKTYTRSWTITSNPGSAYDTNFLKVTVSIGNQSLVSAVCKQ